ncbi:MAG: tRNA uracil 4-sulfurtransferase ThiI [Bacilli bacterium]|nr:tRNA 4-thiouridine(8) synthase ThiI [Bacilli bacterium]
MYDLILVRYGEMTLKKKNYKQFQDKINKNIKRKLAKFSNLKFSYTSYRFYIYLNNEDFNEVIDILNTVVGLHSYSLCRLVEPDYDKIAKSASELISEIKQDRQMSFKVETNRGDKNFPATSIDISREVARRILPNVEGLSVDVRNPQLTLNIDLRSEGTYIFVNSISGLGGYPSGMAGSGLLMMSGGIDSPVAGFLTIKKGVNLTALHFASPPYTSDMSLQKVIDLTEEISKYTLDEKIDLIVFPFTKIQEKIYQSVNPIYNITIMRRAMYKIAEKLAQKFNYDVIVNGESIGQVASQTLESMRVINEVTNYPIIRPLATFDKDEVIKISRKINTYEISIKPYEDCCTIFVPEHPVIKPKLDKVLIEENKCNLDDLIEEGINNLDIYNLTHYKKTNLFTKENHDKFEI